MRKELEEWQKMILKIEGLNEWKVKNTKTGGGLCQLKAKRIICKENNRPLFLHEVAHALLPKRGHDVVWADIFTELCRRYLPYPEINGWAVIDKEYPKQILFHYDNQGNPHLDIHFLKEEAIKARNKWKKAYKPKAEVIPIKILVAPQK